MLSLSSTAQPAISSSNGAQVLQSSSISVSEAGDATLPIAKILVFWLIQERTAET